MRLTSSCQYSTKPVPNSTKLPCKLAIGRTRYDAEFSLIVFSYLMRLSLSFAVRQYELPPNAEYTNKTRQRHQRDPWQRGAESIGQNINAEHRTPSERST